MADLWLPGWERIEGESSGSWAGDDETAEKGVAHTTEGGSIEGAVAAYRQNRSWPHVTADRARRRKVQHLPLNVPARALKNLRGGVETNREPRVIQVELVGFAAETDTWPVEDLDWIGREVIGPMSRAAGVPLTTDVTFYGEGAGWTLATASARQRLSAQQWDTYRGWLGHQHVPENDHWDPGAIDMRRILAAAGGATMSEEDDMPLTDADLDRIEERVRETIRAETPAIARKLNDVIARSKLTSKLNELLGRKS